MLTGLFAVTVLLIAVAEYWQQSRRGLLPLRTRVDPDSGPHSLDGNFYRVSDLSQEVSASLCPANLSGLAEELAEIANTDVRVARMAERILPIKGRVYRGPCLSRQLLVASILPHVGHHVPRWLLDYMANPVSRQCDWRQQHGHWT